jgi:hypothetical protein
VGDCGWDIGLGRIRNLPLRFEQPLLGLKFEILTWRSQNQKVVARKSEIRISKFETNPKSEI